MTTEMLKERIEKKEAQIKKIEKRVAKHEEGTYDHRWAVRDLEEAQKTLANYKAKLEEQVKRENSRNVTVIIEFLNNWKEESFKFYHEMLPQFLEAKSEFEEEYKRVCEEVKGLPFNQKWRAKDECQKAFNAKWKWIDTFVFRGEIDDKELTEALNREADRKYDFIIERTKEIVDEITSADRLHIEKGELNGFIEGTKGTAKVTTIGAGGYNIQRYHFRTLVKRA